MVCTLLIAPQTTEFGAKVALLSGLVVLCVARLFLERFLPAAGSERDRLGAFARAGGSGDRYLTPGRALGRGAIVGATVVVIGATVIAAGAPARESLVAVSAVGVGQTRPPSRRSTCTWIPRRSHRSRSIRGHRSRATCRRPTRRRSR